MVGSGRSATVLGGEQLDAPYTVGAFGGAAGGLLGYAIGTPGSGSPVSVTSIAAAFAVWVSPRRRLGGPGRRRRGLRVGAAAGSLGKSVLVFQVITSMTLGSNSLTCPSLLPLWRPKALETGDDG